MIMRVIITIGIIILSIDGKNNIIQITTKVACRTNGDIWEVTDVADLSSGIDRDASTICQC